MIKSKSEIHFGNPETIVHQLRVEDDAVHWSGTRNKFQRHCRVLIWKSYVQRQRRWRMLLLETLLACIFFTIAVLTAKPVFLTPLQAEPEPPITTTDILKSLKGKNILGFAPNIEPYVTIMERAATTLEHDIFGAESEEELNNNLFVQSKVGQISAPVIWIIWNATINGKWQFRIRSTERAKYETSWTQTYAHPHLRAGFLAVQMAISNAIIQYAATTRVSEYSVSLVAMPVSPLMEEAKVRRAVSGILLCFTLALLAPILETVALVVYETDTRFKRALRIREVSYVSIYAGWLMFALLTSLPISVLASVTVILIFRWVHIVQALVLILAYATVLTMLAFIIAMFHRRGWIACVWAALFAFLQTYLAELIVHHQYDQESDVITFLMQILLPPLGLVLTFNKFALLETGHSKDEENAQLLAYTLFCWSLVCGLCFLLLMLLQYTIGMNKAIGGQVSVWSIIFKQEKDVNELLISKNLTGNERNPLQEVDDLVAKAISFRDVTKSVMGVDVLNNVTLDIYRGEFTVLFAERIQSNLIEAVENLLTGLTEPDSGSITVCGQEMSKSLMTQQHMMGYCHSSYVLIDDMTVREHFTMFFDIVLWAESPEYTFQYSDVRTAHLLMECDLLTVEDYRVSDLDVYYRAQLCWALAMMMEPRIVILSRRGDAPEYCAVIKDKIMQYKKYMTIVMMSHSSIQLEYADRVFLFDSKTLTFGGTPAYMFFKYDQTNAFSSQSQPIRGRIDVTDASSYWTRRWFGLALRRWFLGREYRVRMTLRNEKNSEDVDEATNALLAAASQAGATVRAHLGSLLILRVPASPTEKVANLVTEIHQNSVKYGVTSMNISVPDSVEVFRRAINEARRPIHDKERTPNQNKRHKIIKNALEKIAEPVEWEKKRRPSLLAQFQVIGWKVFTFYKYYKFFLMLVLLSSFGAGIMIGLSFSILLLDSERESAGKSLLHGELLTVEFVNRRTLLMMRSDNSSTALSIANAYIFSEPNTPKKQTEKILYTAIARPESLTEYLVTRAIDAPQKYIYMYAYGLDVYINGNGTLIVNVLYCPLHYDYGAAARSMAKSYTALLRHFTGNYAASIQVTDDPLALDLSPWMKFAKTPPLLIQFLLIVSTSHMTLIPSLEHGLIRHTQKHSMYFSPTRYWLMLFIWDLIVYWIMVSIMTVMMLLVMLIMAPGNYFSYLDLLMLPFILISYGIGCIPQAYLFSLGPRVALNTMTYIFVNVVFGETTIIAEIFYGEAIDYLLYVMSFSPQFNMAYALLKLKVTFLYNSECYIFKLNNLCSKKILHKCCQKCGILQNCFTKKTYINRVLNQVFALIAMASVFMAILILIEYRVFNIVWKNLAMRCRTTSKIHHDELKPGAAREKADVDAKKIEITTKQNKSKYIIGDKIDTFGEYLLAQDLTEITMGIREVDSVNLGLGKGELLALTGVNNYGRKRLCNLLAGVTMASEGHVWCMSKWRQDENPHTYARHVSYSCQEESLPPWMTVFDGLYMIAILRGVPKKHSKDEVMKFIDALDLRNEDHTQINPLPRIDHMKMHFAAAVVGAPPVIMLDECTSYQRFSVRRSMYSILFSLRKRDHAFIMCSNNVESHIPVTSRLALVVDGSIFDVDSLDNLVARYSRKGFTVVLHLKNEVNVSAMFNAHFAEFIINDTSEVLVNVQVLDAGLNWATIFSKMENLKKENQQVYSYIITVTTVDYIYHTILQGKGARFYKDFYGFKQDFKHKRAKYRPTQEALARLRPFQTKYDITKLNELPWSVIFHT